MCEIEEKKRNVREKGWREWSGRDVRIRKAKVKREEKGEKGRLAKDGEKC